MNVNDMQLDQGDLEVPCRLTAIFDRQKSLMEKYHGIEERNGLLLDPSVPVDLDHRFGQQRLKDFSWRVSEELGEATAAFEDHPNLTEHLHEELIDALHFLIELLILSGLQPEMVIKTLSSIHGDTRKKYPNLQHDLLESLFMWNFPEDYGLQWGSGNGFDPTACLPIEKEQLFYCSYLVVHEMARAMNCLKNKPWKQTNMLTDVPRFHNHLSHSLLRFIELAGWAGMGPDKIYEIYVLKNKVNKFRQRSNY